MVRFRHGNRVRIRHGCNVVAVDQKGLRASVSMSLNVLRFRHARGAARGLYMTVSGLEKCGDRWGGDVQGVLFPLMVSAPGVGQPCLRQQGMLGVDSTAITPSTSQSEFHLPRAFRDSQCALWLASSNLATLYRKVGDGAACLPIHEALARIEKVCRRCVAETPAPTR